jgi:hypothetical protein
MIALCVCVIAFKTPICAQQNCTPDNNTYSSLVMVAQTTTLPVGLGLFPLGNGLEKRHCQSVCSVVIMAT